ncbi:MAG: hypothetical protein ACT4QG_13795 [Sporichthyaceae bacterium]
MPDEIRSHVRDEVLPDDATVIVRGGPDSLEKLAQHAARTNRAFLLDGHQLWGVSVFLALDDAGSASAERILADRMRTYRIVHLTNVAQVRASGIGLLPTFARPRYTLLMRDASARSISALAVALGPGSTNPYHVAKRRG